MNGNKSSEAYASKTGTLLYSLEAKAKQNKA